MAGGTLGVVDEGVGVAGAGLGLGVGQDLALVCFCFLGLLEEDCFPVVRGVP
jgi:hypothetical protein